MGFPDFGRGSDGGRGRMLGLHVMDLLYLVCALHLAMCIAHIALTSPGSGDDYFPRLADTVGHTLRVANAAFACISIVGIIGAGVGALYLIERHLLGYLVLLVASAAVDVAWVAVLIRNGQVCQTLVPDAEIEKSSVACRFTAGMPLACFTLSLCFKLFGIAVTSRARKLIRMRYSEELLPHLRKSLQESFGSFAADGAGRVDGREQDFPFAAAASPQPYAGGYGGGEAASFAATLPPQYGSTA